MQSPIGQRCLCVRAAGPTTVEPASPARAIAQKEPLRPAGRPLCRSTGRPATRLLSRLADRKQQRATRTGAAAIRSSPRTIRGASFTPQAVMGEPWLLRTKSGSVASIGGVALSPGGAGGCTVETALSQLVHSGCVGGAPPGARVRDGAEAAGACSEPPPRRSSWRRSSRPAAPAPPLAGAASSGRPSISAADRPNQHQRERGLG